MINKLEKKFGRYAIKNLIYYVLGGYVVGYILALTNSRLGLYQYILLDPAMVMKGQVWRLFTWILTPPQALNLWIIFMFMLYYFIGKALEQYLGAFRYNLYMFSGWFFTTLGAMIVYWVSGAIYGSGAAISMNVSTYFINLASFLAFAVIYPDVKVYLFGILPLKVKWLAWIDVGYLALEIISAITVLVLSGKQSAELAQIIQMYGLTQSYTNAVAITEIFSILVSLLNFLIFFLMNRKMRRLSPEQIYRRNAWRRAMNEQAAQQSARREQQEAAAASAGAAAGQGAFRPNVPAGGIVHKCAVCGRTSVDYPDLQFRYCSKCNGNFEYCQDHLFTHEHVK